jgi:hypothetical protein
LKINYLDFLFFLWNSGLATSLVIFFNKLIKAHTKNKNLLLLNTWAEQAITWADNNVGNNMDLATTFIQKRLDANNLQGRFSNQQIEAVLLQAGKTLKGE